MPRRKIKERRESGKCQIGEGSSWGLGGGSRHTEQGLCVNGEAVNRVEGMSWQQRLEAALA